MPTLANYRSGLKSISNYNNVENFSKEQFGYLGEPLIVSDSILDAIIVHHMNSNNVNYLKSAPQIPNGAPMADFIYEDIMLRSEEIIQRYLCGEDEILATRSQMSRMILKHLKKYHGLLKSTAKEAKLALNKERKRKMIITNASSNLSLSNVSNMVSLKKEIEKKERELLRVSLNKNTSKKQQLTTILEQLKKRKMEVSKKLNRVAPEKKSRAKKLAKKDMDDDTRRLNYSELLVQTYKRLHVSTQLLISPSYMMKSVDTTNPKNVFNYAENRTGDYNCASYPMITDSNTAHLVFASHAFALGIPTKTPNFTSKKSVNEARFSKTEPHTPETPKHYFLLQCEDTRVASSSAADFEEWKSDSGASKLVPYQGVVESLNRKQIPFRTVFGDRLVKRRLVLHSFVERLNAALYPNYNRNNTRSELHPLYNRFSGLFLDNMNNTVNNNHDGNLIVSSNANRKDLNATYGVTVFDALGIFKNTGVFCSLPNSKRLNFLQVQALIKDIKVPKGLFQPPIRKNAIEIQTNTVFTVTKTIHFSVPGSSTFSSLEQWKKRSSAILLSLIKKDNSKSKIGNVNTTTDDLLWNQNLRSFGSSGSQDYWIQLLREMYDSRRVENIRSKLRIINSKQKKNTALTPQEVLTKFKDLQLGDNLGVSCYGYACNPRDPSAPWSTSYHRLGRSWFCSDTNKDAFQLPFGCYSDKCAPPFLPVSHPNYHSSNGGTEPSRVRGNLELIAVNNICTTVLQPESKHGTQGRYGHIRTTYKGQKIGKMSPTEVFGVFSSIRQANGHNDKSTTVPYEIRMGLNDKSGKMNNGRLRSVEKRPNTVAKNFRIQIITGPELELSVLKARKAVSLDDHNTNSGSLYKSGTVLEPLGINMSVGLNNYENLSNNISSKKNTQLIFNVNTLKNESRRHKALRKHFLGYSNDWNSTALGPKKVTGRNVDSFKFKKMGAGLKRSLKNVNRDTETLDDNFMMIDGDIFTGCDKSVDYLLHGGSERALGITKKFQDVGDEREPVIPLILPLNVFHGSYRQIKKRARLMFNNLHDDSTGAMAGLVKRQMENVCIPIFKSGSLLKGTHFNDLMDRFLSAVGDLDAKGENLELKLQSPKLYNIMKCLQFYLYLHVGLTTQDALTEIAKYQARKNAKAIQSDMFSLSTKLRLLGNTGPMPKNMFKKLVRQYLLTSKNNAYIQPEEVQSEIEELTNKIESFKILGKKLARQKFLPSFMGGTQYSNKKMGRPSEGFKNPVKSRLEKLMKPLVDQKEKIMIGSGGNKRLIKNTNIRMSQRDKVQQNVREKGAVRALRVKNALRPGNPRFANLASAPLSYVKGLST